MEAPLHKLCGTKHWSNQPCPAMAPTKSNTPRGRSGTARKAPGEQSTAKADIEALKQGAKPAARKRGPKRLDDLGLVQDGLKMSSDGPESGKGQDRLADLPPASVKRKDTRKGDRHKPGYWAQYQRDYRARKRAEKAQGK